MAYGENKGRFREIRVGRFDSNMGAVEAPVKSTDVEETLGDQAIVSKKLQNAPHSCTLKGVYFLKRHHVGCRFLAKKKGDRRTRASAGKNRSPCADEPREDDGPDEAAGFIAEAAADLARLAERHRLEMLGRLLRMSQLEADEYVRLRSKPRLS
jgi:hypothetical protein